MSSALVQNSQATGNPWDFPASFAGLNDGDFLAMLEKQVNQHPLTQQSYTLTPPLSEEDSSPSPPHSDGERTNTHTPDDNHKRKVSPDDDDDLDDEQPAHKSHRDSMDGPDNKKANRRKSTGGQKDESRLMKRKEQNRAAQRAFRERKEKHTAQLEDRVASLEAEKAETQNENENLKDLLNRLQTENQLLKQGQFTFSMPGPNKRPSSDGSSDSSPAASSSSNGQEPVFSQTSPPIDMSSNNPIFNASEPSLTSASDTNLSMFGSFPVTPTWTTLATAPQYTSYRDPVYDRIFGGAGDISPYATRGDEEGEGLVNLEELFGEDFGDLMPIVGDFSPVAEAVLGPIDATMRDDSAAAPLPSVQGAHDPQQEHGDCPRTKEDITHMIANHAPQTFGPPLADLVPPFVPPAAAAAAEKDELCPIAADLGLTTPLSKADPNVPHVPIGEAWNQDCDIDELCSLLKEKARCGGDLPVIEKPTLGNILQKMGTQRTA
ncbi:hypothetical protein CALVIDRAFT_350334 [Calocera viscosa TUFC12733]|uniref:BZIP domain-containing protein n=1 Tax=Calocera viscosa (strain TUFC12733) TaxID=1330018 RepID=A0A167QBG4_CALVF|nr:hypothetical protein CALVIDRAFT_350334 [Calocera viscosa TUFC12733]